MGHRGQFDGLLNAYRGLGEDLESISQTFSTLTKNTIYLVCVYTLNITLKTDC